jgi:hypothetical protein
MDGGYKVLALHTVIEFAAGATWRMGEIVRVEYNPNRAPGIARVSYVVKFHPAYEPVTVPANRVREVA